MTVDIDEMPQIAVITAFHTLCCVGILAETNPVYRAQSLPPAFHGNLRMPTRTNLTKCFIEGLTPTAASAVDYADHKVSALLLRLMPSGARSFGLRYTVKNRLRRKSYGLYPILTLNRARELVPAVVR